MSRAASLAFALALFATSALGQVVSGGGGSGGTTNPGGSPNQIQFNSGGTAFGGFTMSGDCTLVVGTGAITCTKTNGVSFATTATTQGLLPANNLSDVNSTATSLANLGAAAAWFPAYQSTWWYVPPYVTAITGSALNSGRMGCGPFTIPKSITIIALGVRINTAGSTAIQLAVYANSGGYPSGSPLITTASIPDTAVGNVSASVTATTLVPGVYWACEESNDSTVVIQGVSQAFSTQSGVTGAPAQADLVSNTAALNEQMYYIATFGTWPSLSSTGATWQAGATYTPMIQMEEQ